MPKKTVGVSTGISDKAETILTKIAVTPYFLMSKTGITAPQLSLPRITLTCATHQGDISRDILSDKIREYRVRKDRVRPIWIL